MATSALSPPHTHTFLSQWLEETARMTSPEDVASTAPPTSLSLSLSHTALNISLCGWRHRTRLLFLHLISHFSPTVVGGEDRQDDCPEDVASTVPPPLSLSLSHTHIHCTDHISLPVVGGADGRGDARLERLLPRGNRRFRRPRPRRPGRPPRGAAAPRGGDSAADRVACISLIQKANK